MPPTETEARILRVYRISLALKGLNGLAEALGGALLLVTPPLGITQWVARLTFHELAEDPQDRLASHLLHAAQSLPLSTERFYAIWLLAHGFMKMALVAALFYGRRRPYPAALGVLALFITYQLYRASLTGSLPLAALTAFDIFLSGLIAHEWWQARKHPPAARKT